MQTRRTNIQSEMMLLPSIEERIPGDYYLRRLNGVIDLSFVHDLVRDRYCQDNGRPSIDPEVIIRLFLLQAITGRESIRELMQEVDMHLGYRWFIGYGATEALPDHSTLSKALMRFGDEVFDEVFRRSIAQCRQSGLIRGKLLHVDATTIRADIDKDRVNKPDSSDVDARFGRFGDGSKQPGYKQQTVVDDQSRVVLAVSVQPANAGEGKGLVAIVDEATAPLELPPEVVCADSAYASGENRFELERRGIRLVSPPGHGHNHHSGGQFTIERFIYNEQRDVFICPSGKMLVKVGRYSGKKIRWKYRASIRDCRVCSLKGDCTGAPQRCLNVSGHHSALVRLRVDSKTDSFRRLYRRRAPVIEGIFAEAKQWHGLGRAWRRGLAKMRVQCFLIAAVLNFKRLIAVFLTIFRAFGIHIGIIATLISSLFEKTSNRTCSDKSEPNSSFHSLPMIFAHK